MKKQQNTITQFRMIGLGIIGGIGVILSVLSNKVSPKPSEPTPQPNKQVYIAYQLNNDKAVKFARIINYEFSHVLNSESPVNVDIMKDKLLSNIYGPSSGGSLKVLDKDLHEVSKSDEKALIPAINRVKELLNEKQELHAFIVSEGTNDNASIKEIQRITQEIANKNPTNFSLYLIGVNPDHKIRFSGAFHPIKKYVYSCPNNQLEQCLFFINSLDK